MASANCPSCGRQLEVEDAYRDWTVRCPHCAHEFVPNPPDPRDDQDEYDDDDDDYVYGHEGPGHDQARRAVSGPGLWLEILGWGGVFITSTACILLITIGLSMMNNNGRDEDAILLIVLGGGAAALGLPSSLVIALGGRHMRNLTSRGWSQAAAITCMLFFWLFGICGALHLGIGVWALVMLEKPFVRRAFGLPSRRDARRRDWND